MLDDGSYFLEAMACYAHVFRGISIVEQTTRGVIKIAHDATLRSLCARLPVINVAESDPKKTLESPFIGEAVCKALVRRLAGRLQPGARTRCLVMGYGAIGREVIRALIERVGLSPSRISVHDPQPESQRRAAAAGHPLWDRDRSPAPRFHLVVGCSGTTSFTIGDRVFLEDGALLASASSGAAELSREEFIDLADAIPDDDIYVNQRGSLAALSIHTDLQLRVVDRDIWFLNGGFPINFEGQVN